MTSPTASKLAVGLALSGGGFRATAFGLGALRALHDRGVLDQVRVVSGISGGSLLTAMWAYGPKSFDEFDASVTDLLRSGLQRELIGRALRPGRLARGLSGTAGAVLPGRFHRTQASTRTEALVSAIRAHDFGSKTMTDVTHSGLEAIVSATDLASGNAVRFGSMGSACSPYGVIDADVPVADAVAASAAFPAILPQLTRTYTFTQQNDQSQHTRTVLMTDGGVYDNLGLSPLLPGRSKKFTHHVYDLPYLIAVDAGAGRTTSQPPDFVFGRMKRTLEIAHTRAQDGTRARIHESREAGVLKGHVYAYLGMQDRNLPVPVADLVTRDRVYNYPTDFKAMSAEDLGAVAGRGEQLTRVLLSSYCPELGT
ncbi:MAG: patatin-like phospholipase family protein [Nocardioides sp.]|nr:patatin-like phospholipase family protein [Nocardioides sp.]